MNDTSTAATFEELQERCFRLEQENAELTARLNWFMEHFRIGQHRQFGSSSEKTPPPEQPSLFNEVEAEAKPDAPEPSMETITYKRKKQQGHREEALADLPVEIVEHRLPEEEQICSQCGGHRHEMSTEVHDELVIVPAQAKVVRHVYYVYGCRRCEREDISVPIVTAPGPAPVIPGSIASPSSVAFIMNGKYVDGLPLYRQKQALDRLGVNLSRQCMANWMILAAERWLSKIYDRLHEELLKLDLAHADETTLQVLHEDGRASESKSYMWLYRSGRYDHPIVLFDYQVPP